MFENRNMGTQVSDDELKRIGSDYGRPGDLTKESGFYHVGSGMILRGKVMAWP